MTLHAKIKEKGRLLDEILRDLENLKKREFENLYAVDENIKSKNSWLWENLI